MYTFSFIVGNTIPKSVKCIHSATKFLDWELETAAWGAKVGRQESTQAKNQVRDIPYRPPYNEAQ